MVELGLVVEVSAVSSQEFGLQFDQLTQIIRSVHSKSAKENEKEIMEQLVLASHTIIIADQ